MPNHDRTLGSEMNSTEQYDGIREIFEILYADPYPDYPDLREKLRRKNIGIVSRIYLEGSLFIPTVYFLPLPNTFDLQDNSLLLNTTKNFLILLAIGFLGGCGLVYYMFAVIYTINALIAWLFLRFKEKQATHDNEV